ncbi:hypothetical protein FIV42_05065 [Persicimonas caeni]|uniref:Lipoprotein n=1 Tax=Persicimonas caeni TaxID=2292766 RepID=A0A4Y6PQS6_PERCE|nr:hypothetical protein [Persicimonas caeni]QDG50125.1 hypothetical protein FIV42_05065 [Persicimonas caeni]QED31346.1 hypothetical protein FRD00_05060 [Persicimonas caeni]
MTHPRLHNLLALSTASLALLASACETSGPTADEAKPAQSAKPEPLTQPDDVAAEPCAAKMEAVAEKLRPFRLSRSLPDFAAADDELVAMPADIGEALLPDSPTSERFDTMTFVELMPDGRVRLGDAKAPIDVAKLEARLVSLQRRRAKEAQMLQQSAPEPMQAVVVARSDAQPSALADVIFALNKAKVADIAFAYAAEGVEAEMLPVVTIETELGVDAQVERYRRHLRASDAERDELREQDRAFHDKVFGEPWNAQCHRTWTLALAGRLDDAEDVVDPDETACCAQTNWSAVQYLTVGGEQRSYASWRVVSAKMSGVQANSSPLAKLKLKQNHPVLKLSAGDSYRAFLQKVVEAGDELHVFVFVP